MKKDSSQPPQITLSPDTNDVTVYQGDPLDLVCSADGARVQWKKNGVIIAPHVDGTARIYKPSAGFDDRGTYDCSAYNDAGTRVKSIRVMVRTNPPIQYKVSIGDGAKISCEIENAVKILFWRRQDSRPLPSSSHLAGGDLVRAFLIKKTFFGPKMFFSKLLFGNKIKFFFIQIFFLIEIRFKIKSNFRLLMKFKEMRLVFMNVLCRKEITN